MISTTPKTQVLGKRYWNELEFSDSPQDSDSERGLNNKLSEGHEVPLNVDAVSINSSDSAKTKRSTIWKYFISDKEKGTAECNLCKWSTDRGKAQSSTSGLWRHLRHTHPITHARVKGEELDVVTKQGSLDKFLQDGTLQSEAFTLATYKKYLFNWIIMDNQPFTVVEDPHFRLLLKLCNPEADPVSADTVRNMVDVEFTRMEKQIMHILQNAPGTISFTADCWTSQNMIPFLGITAHFIDEDWQMTDFILDFIALEGSHTGSNLAAEFLGRLDDLGVTTKLFQATLDNASNNNSMMDCIALSLHSRAIPFHKNENRIRCIAHIINLSVQAALKCLKAEAEDEELTIASDDYDLDSAETVKKLRKLIVAIRSSPQRRESFAKCVRNSSPDNLQLVIDVITRWNSTYDMLERSLKLKEPITTYSYMNKQLTVWVPSEQEWGILAEMKTFLEIFVDATKKMSGVKYVTLPMVIPTYNFLMDKLDKYCSDMSISSQIRTAAQAAFDKLSEYYTLTDTNTAYMVAATLHPCIEPTFLDRAEFTAAEQEGVRSLVANVYETKYKPINPPTTMSDVNKVDAEGFLDFCLPKPKPSNKSELDLYFAAPKPRNRKTCPLKWWKAHEQEYPNLARMARDYLGIPATSVPIERAFSVGVDMVTSTRCSLKPATIRKCMCLKAWKELPSCIVKKLQEK